MYSNKVALAIKSKGMVLREHGDTIYLPFASEYSVYIKNLSNVRIAAKITIDGTDVADGTVFIVDPNTEIEVERFVRNGNLAKGNRFKFIERSHVVSAHRADKPEDGLIRIEYQFEKPIANPVWNLSTTVSGTTWPGTTLYPPSVRGSSGSLDTTGSQYIVNNAQTTDSFTTANSVPFTASAGITAPGSISEQQFITVSEIQLETHKHVMILQLKGEVVGNYVSAPITTKSRSTCITCGKQSKTTAAFCSVCGTSLQII